MDKLKKTFGEVLFQLRTEKAMTQEKLAELCDVDKKYIYLLEKGQRQPSLTTVFAIAIALNLAPSELVLKVEKKVGRKK